MNKVWTLTDLPELKTGDNLATTWPSKLKVFKYLKLSLLVLLLTTGAWLGKS